MEEIKIAETSELSKINLLQLPKRPLQSKYFDKQPISLKSNHYNIVVPKSMEIFVYDFKFNPDIDRDNRKKVRFYIRSFSEQIEKQLGKFEYSGWMMFTTKKIENITLQGEIDKNEVKMEIKFTKQCQNLKDIMSLSIEKSESTKQIMNIIIKNCFKELGYKEIGLRKNFYDVTKKKILQELNIEMWLGFYTSTEYFQSGPKLTVDCASKILRLDTANNYIKDLIKSGKNQLQIKKEMEFTSVMAYYGNGRAYQIHDVDFTKNPTSKFDTNKGPITFKDYFKTRYCINIIDITQPLLLHNKRERTSDGNRIIVKIYLIPELVRMTGLTDTMRKNRKCMKMLADEKPTKPNERISEIQNVQQRLQSQLNKSFWNLQLQATEKIEGILMQQPEIMFGNKVKAKPMNGQFRLQGTVYEPATFNSKWVLIYQEVNFQRDQYPFQQGQYDYDTAELFVKSLQKCSGKLGILVNEPEYIAVGSINPKDYATQLINYLSKNKPLIIVSLIRRKNTTEVYKAIKLACYVSSKNSLVIPSQNVLMETIQNADQKIQSICCNILLQMNAKMNLAIWLVQPVKNFPKNVMLIGADVHHKKGNKSIIGFCATLNSTFSAFYSRAKEQQKEYDEIMKSIGQFVFEGLLAYYAKNKQLPEHIIFFRDGVGDSQIEEVRQIEVKQVLSAFDQIKKKFELKNFEPTFAEIIVNKKINDKFFVENEGDTGHSKNRGNRGTEKSTFVNAPSGTIINSNVVSNNFDYYMIAQNVNQGTATPTHYNVIYNTTSLTEDQFLELTFRQCFNYYNWQGAIKIPSVVKYADKLAFFYGTYLNRESDPELFEFLYYL